MDYIFMIVIGIIIIIHTIIKPRYFWEHRKARGLRKRYGDRVTSVAYFVMGGLFLIMGVLIVILTAFNKS